MTAVMTLPTTTNPFICGHETEIQAIMQHQAPVFLPVTNINIQQVQSGFACALHMHQPTIPAGPNGALIGNLQHMLEGDNDGDRYNAGVFAWCYSRMGEFIPELIAAGGNPRIMLDYSGNLLWGLQQMGRSDVLEKLKPLAHDPRYYPHVEWMGTMWSHAVAPSTPIPDLKLHMRAWQHQFMAIFGAEALQRVRGFSPPEMHLPNHPDTLYEYVKALRECGYQWLLVQEHSIENLNGTGLTQAQKYVPNQLIAMNSHGETVGITVLIKTQGSDTKLVAQMQPYHEAKVQSRQTINGKVIPSLVAQIADGENGGVMMNEFPSGYKSVWPQIQADPSVVSMNGTEYLELLASIGVTTDDYPKIQAVQQHRIWQQVGDTVTPEAVASAIAAIKQEDGGFHMDGASWTNDLSWVKGYENVLEPMNKLSALFHAKFDPLVQADLRITARSDYQEALLYNLLVQTSCFRYWGQGIWTDYAQELYRRGEAAIASAY